MKKIFSILAVLVMTMGIFSANVQAAESRDMKVFKEAWNTPAKELDLFHQDIFFVMPTIQSSLEFFSQTKNNSQVTVSGEFGIWYINQMGAANEIAVPFYINHNGKNMHIYYKLGDAWRKFETPSIVSSIADNIATPEEADVEMIMSMVKDVKILQESDKRRTFLVQLDGHKIAKWLAESNKKNPADKGSANDGDFQDNVLKYLQEGFKKSENWYTWTVDAKDNHTLTVSFNFSGAIQVAALTALQDKKQNWNELETDLLESIAFYSDFRAYTTFLNVATEKDIEIPAEVLNAASSDNLLPDDMTR